MSEITTVGLDLAKHVFQVHGVDAAGATVLRKQLRRAQVLARKMHRLGRISCKVLIFRGIKFATQISAAFAEPHRP